MGDKNKNFDDTICPTYGRRLIKDPLSGVSIPDRGAEPRAVQQICEDQLALDGKPSLNLASFVTTWMEPEARQLIDSCLNKNLVDQDEYPQVVKIHQCCVRMMASLLHAPDADQSATGTSTVGSSEAVMLAGLALKWRWRAARREKGLSADKPNLVMGSNVQVVWEKFTRYFDVEPKIIGLPADPMTLTPEQVTAAVDENTIGVVCILGTTYTGDFEPIADIAKALDTLAEETGLDVPIHVDAASGGFVAPFSQPKLKWDFRISRVASINVSGHKYGLVYPGVGWVVWRGKAFLPNELVFEVNYLGGDMPTFNLNFSRPSAFVVAQYYNFLRLGRAGYTDIITVLLTLSARLAVGLASLDTFEFLSRADTLPVVAVTLKAGQAFTVYQLSDYVRMQGWIVPAYKLPKPADDTDMLRFVIREGMSAVMIDQLLQDVGRAVEQLSGGQADHLKRGGSASHIC